MTRWQQTWEVARWEFTRFVKWKQQVIGFAVLLVLGLGGGLAGRAIAGAEQKPRMVAVIAADLLGFPLPEAKPVSWDSSEAWTIGVYAVVELLPLLLGRSAPPWPQPSTTPTVRPARCCSSCRCCRSASHLG